MIEVPTLFLATHCSSLSEARHWETPDADRLSFAPGFLALGLLCGVVTGSPGREGPDVIPSDHLIYLDGPPNPVADEGFQLLRLTEEVTRQLSTLRPDMAEAIAADWFWELRRFDLVGHELPVLMAAIDQLAELARRGKNSGKFLFVKVLYR